MASSAIIALTAIILLSMGRPPFCKCGIIRLWSGDIWSNQNSQQLADPYTFTHVMHGAILYLLLWLAGGKRLPISVRLVCAVTLEAGWEILENTSFIINRYREATISLDYYGDSVFNSIGDIFAMISGFILAWRLPWRITVAGSLILDATLLFFIHDSLALNIIMLIHPTEAIRLWQLR